MKINPFAVMKEEFDGSGIVFNADNNKVMTLNASGVILWKAFENGASLQEAANELTSHFSGVSSAEALADAEKFRQKLIEKSLLLN